MKTSVAWGLAVMAALAPAFFTPLHAQPSLEYTVKAAYLSKFAPFIDWPEGAFAAAAAPLVICVVGADPMGANLDRAVQGQKDREHPLTVRRLAAPDPATPCHILFTADAAMAEAALASARTRPVLTVTDARLPVQGMISFVRVGNTVRFDIDEAQAQSARLTISSKLLALARSVKRGTR